MRQIQAEHCQQLVLMWLISSPCGKSYVLLKPQTLPFKGSPEFPICCQGWSFLRFCLLVFVVNAHLEGWFSKLFSYTEHVTLFSSWKAVEIIKPHADIWGVRCSHWSPEVDTAFCWLHLLRLYLCFSDVYSTGQFSQVSTCSAEILISNLSLFVYIGDFNAYHSTCWEILHTDSSY